MPNRRSVLFLILLLAVCIAMGQTRSIDTRSDTWAATDALGRDLPDWSQVGGPRKDRFVGIFYFLRATERETYGPFDVSQILSEDPGAISNPDSPLWGAVRDSHWWGRPMFGYYISEDEYVLRKHAQMLADAGVDSIFFDVSNRITFTPQVLRLMQVFEQIRSEGGRTPQIAFLCPFSDPAQTVRKLATEIYAKDQYSDLWFKWKGKPLILAAPERLGIHNADSQQVDAVEVQRDKSLGQSFIVDQPLSRVGVRLATFGTTDAGVRVSLFSEDNRRIASRRFDGVPDNGWMYLELKAPVPAGKYRIVLSNPKGHIAWWSDGGTPFFTGQADIDGTPATGVRSLDLDTTVPGIGPLEKFFTFRAPQPSYFVGPTGPNMWSWLEQFPQHVFYDRRGKAEQMSVGVAQNAVDGKLSSMSQPGAEGRSWHDGAEDKTPNAVDYGFNFQQQFDHALKSDPEFIFVTGWNEWTAMRLTDFVNTTVPVVFVDEFNQEFSRDIEPMLGGHGDDYYYQLVANIRRYKGVRRTPRAGPAHTIDIDGGFAQWDQVRPVYLDDSGDAARRDEYGWNHKEHYVNGTGRNDFVTLKVARDRDNVYFYAQTKDPISTDKSGSWMNLFIKTDDRAHAAWEGYQYAINRQAIDGKQTRVEESTGGWNWITKAVVRYRVAGNEMMIAVPREALGLSDPSAPVRFEFKWADSTQTIGSIDDFTLNGDAAPNGRFNYKYVQHGKRR